MTITISLGALAGDIPVFVSFAPLVDQALSSSVTTAWTRVLGPDGVVNVTAPGQYQIADDAAGTNATVAATSGSFILNNAAPKYIRLLINTSGSGRTATQVTVTLNGVAFKATAITSAVTVYPTVNNGGTACSRWDTVGSVTGIAKGVIARRMRTNAVVAGSVAMAGKSTSNFQTNMVTSPAAEERVQLVNGATHLAKFNIRSHALNTWFDDLIAWDWTLDNAAYDKAQICKMVRNFEQQQMDVANSVIATAGGTLRTTLSTLLGSSAPQGLGVFANASGGNIANRQGEWVWGWFGQAADSLPDITDPMLASKFCADSFGASGNASGALPTPHLFFHAGAGGNGPAEWNAGLPNLGSLGGTLSKIAGTYA